MKQLTVKNKKICFSLTSPSDSVKHHVGEYFQVIENQPDHFFLYYKGVDNGKEVIKLAVSGPDFVFSDPRVIVSDSPGGSFCIVKNKDWFCMLCGSNISTGEDRDVDIPDLVWNETKKRSYPDHHRDDRKNGLYLLRSKDGIDWEEISPLPVMHSFLEGDGVSFRLGWF